MTPIERDARNAARYAVGASGLPQLTGSHADIERADSIRADMLLAANGRIGHLDAREAIDRAVQGATRLRSITRASWWIACRNHAMEDLLEDLSHRACALESGREL